MHASALIPCVLTSGLQRGAAYCSPSASLILKIFWNLLCFSLMWCFWMCVIMVLIVLICILILGDCKKYSPVKCNFLEGEFYISKEVKTKRPDSQNITGYAVRWRYLRPMPQIKNAVWKLWQEWQLPVLRESCETKLFQHSQGEKDHYFLILRIQKERSGENCTSTTLARTEHMSSSISQADWNLLFDFKTEYVNLKSFQAWVTKTSFILSICNPQLQCGQVDLPGEQIHQVQTCGLTYLMFIGRSFYRNGCCIKISHTTLRWWTSMCLYRCAGTDYRNKKVCN